MGMPRKPNLDDARREQQRWTGGRIRIAREAAGFTQDELSRLLGFTAGRWLSEIERGANSIDAQELLRIAKVTRYPMEYFLDPKFDTRLVAPPQSVPEWERLYPEHPQLAHAHANLDAAILEPQRERGLPGRRKNALRNLKGSLSDQLIGRNQHTLAFGRR